MNYVERYIITWDRQTDTVPGTYNILSSETDLDWIGMSYLGKLGL